MSLITTLLEEVQEFRSRTSMKNQTEQAHMIMFASETMELLVSDDAKDSADAYADMCVVLAGEYYDHVIDYKLFEKYIYSIGQFAEYADGIDIEKAIKIVMKSNMTKACLHDAVNPTIQKYRAQNIELTWKENNGYWACFAAYDYPDCPKGKLLKPTTYKEPEWSGDEWKI